MKLTKHERNRLRWMLTVWLPFLLVGLGLATLALWLIEATLR